MMRWISLLFLLWGSTAWAKDIGGQYAVHGVGGAPCLDYVAVRESGSTIQLEYEIWLSGYFSAFNLIVSNTYSIMGDRGMVQFLEALDEYCASNPEALFVQGVTDVTMVVFPERQNLSPYVDRWPSLLEEVEASGAGKKENVD